MNDIAHANGLSMARAIEATALTEAGPSEAARTLTQPLVDALWDSGLMQFMNPSEADGSEPVRGGPLYRFGVMPLTGCGHAAWALGVARSAIDDVVALAKEKVRMGDESSIANKLTFQRDLAHHETMWRAAHRLVVDTYTEAGKLLLGLIEDSMAL